MLKLLSQSLAWPYDDKHLWKDICKSRNYSVQNFKRLALHNTKEREGRGSNGTVTELWRREGRGRKNTLFCVTYIIEKQWHLYARSSSYYIPCMHCMSVNYIFSVKTTIPTASIIINIYVWGLYTSYFDFLFSGVVIGIISSRHPSKLVFVLI